LAARATAQNRDDEDVEIVEAEGDGEGEDDEVDVDHGVEGGYVDDLLRRKKKKLRHRYTLALKIELLNQFPRVRIALATRDGVPSDSIDMKRILAVVSHNAGPPASTLDKWHRKETKLRDLFNDKFNRRHKNFGSSGKPRYPKSELAVAKDCA
jgi:hypothetical protein